MSRARWCPRPLVLAVLVWAGLFALIPHLAEATPIPSTLSAADDADRVIRLLENKAVAARLAELGLSADEVAAKVRGLSEEERHLLASRLAEAEVGQGAAAAVAVIIIVALLVIVILELMGRRVISRP